MNFFTDEKMEEIIGYKNVETLDKKLMIPVFNMRPLLCARYARLVAKEVFDKHFNPADAWEMSYNNKPLTEVSDYASKEELLESKITPGDIMLFENPTSKYRGRLDSQNCSIYITHAAIYLGLDKKTHVPIFAEQLKEQVITSLYEFHRRDYKTKRILTI